VTVLPERLFKYTTASTATRVLESSQLRYSSPQLFNDIFDAQAGLHFDFDPTSLPEKFMNRFEELVLSPTKPDLPDNMMAQAILIAWQGKAERGFPRENFRSKLGPILQAIPSEALKFQVESRNLFKQELLHWRILCLSEIPDSLQMWSQYADCHTGAVLSFRVMPEEDNILCAARPVEYRASPPALFSEREWLDHSLGLKDLDYEALLRNYPYVKSLAYAHEREWRVCDSLPAPNPVLFADYPFRKNELETIYLGYRMTPENVNAISSLARERFPEARLLYARPSFHDFTLAFGE
jgi:hypothetical protein